MTGKLIAIATASVAAVIGALYADTDTQAQGTPDHAHRPVQAHVLTPGDIVPADQVDFIERPGLTGLDRTCSAAAMPSSMTIWCASTPTPCR